MLGKPKSKSEGLPTENKATSIESGNMSMERLYKMHWQNYKIWMYTYWLTSGILGWVGYPLRLERDHLIQRRHIFHSNNEYIELVKPNK